jgi:hypothetical protein
MEETLEGGRGPPRAVAPLERERERTKENTIVIEKRNSIISDEREEKTEDPIYIEGK